MSLKNSNKIETNKYELEISVDKDKFEEAVAAAFKKNAKRITVPGFRKGKAPRHIIEKYYGEGVFYEDAVNALYPAAYEEAIRETGLEPVDRADIEVETIGKEGLVFKAKVTVKPEAEIGDYKGLKAVKKIYKVKDEEVDHELEHIRERNARILTVEDRAAKKGDIVVIDFEGFLDGVAFDGGKGEKQELELGSGSFIPGFEDQIEGHKTGDEFDVNVTFPKDYQAKELADKAAVFKVKLNEIKMRELPELDDEFAKDVSEFDTLEAYKADIKKHIQEAKDRKSADDVDGSLIDQIIAGMKVEVPEVMYDSAIDNMVNDFDYRLQMQGLNIKTYLAYTGMKMEEFRKTFHEQAERQVKIRLALEEVAKVENFEVTAEELEEEYKKYAKRYNVEVSRVKTALDVEGVKKDICVSKAVDLIRNEAKITEEEAKEEDEKKAEPKAEKEDDAKKTKD